MSRTRQHIISYFCRLLHKGPLTTCLHNISAVTVLQSWIVGACFMSTDMNTDIYNPGSKKVHKTSLKTEWNHLKVNRLHLWTTEPFEDARGDTITRYQWTCLPVECSNQVLLSIQNFPSLLLLQSNMPSAMFEKAWNTIINAVDEVKQKWWFRPEEFSSETRNLLIIIIVNNWWTYVALFEILKDALYQMQNK